MILLYWTSPETSRGLFFLGEPGRKSCSVVCVLTCGLCEYESRGKKRHCNLNGIEMYWDAMDYWIIKKSRSNLMPDRFDSILFTLKLYCHGTGL